MSAPPTTFRLVEWANPPAENVDPLGRYAETYWLPILHPTAYLLGRRLVHLHGQLDLFHEPPHLTAITLAHALGVVDLDAIAKGGGGLRIFAKAARRLERYQLVRWRDDSAEVRLRWPRMSVALLNALPDQMRHAEHEFWSAEVAQAPETVKA